MTITYTPELQIIEKDSIHNLFFNIPGVKKEDIHVEISDYTTLNVSAKRVHKKKRSSTYIW